MKAVEGPSVWSGKKLQSDPDSWVYNLTKDDKHELTHAISQAKKGYHSSELNIANISKSQFELPLLGPKLEAIQNEIVNGKGFVLIRSLPVEEYGRLDSMIAFWGIGLYLGIPVSQNAKGHILGHVYDLGNDPNLPTTRLYTTNRPQRFHVDSCDIVGLLCLQKALEGGLSSICSSATVYNTLLEKRPDLLEELVSDNFYWDRKGEVPEGKLPYWRQPIFNFFDRKMLGFYDRNFLTTTYRHSGVPPLTEKQIEAIDLMEALCASDPIRLDMVLEPGDMQFIHNHQIFHARTAFSDYPERERKRHLVRLWLSATNGWALPPIFSERYGPNIEVGQKRGGIICRGTEECAPVDPWA